ncbi:unnamed protein product [Victoria cruziana]
MEVKWFDSETAKWAEIFWKARCPFCSCIQMVESRVITIIYICVRLNQAFENVPQTCPHYSSSAIRFCEIIFLV